MLPTLGLRVNGTTCSNTNTDTPPGDNPTATGKSPDQTEHTSTHPTPTNNQSRSSYSFDKRLDVGTDEVDFDCLIRADAPKHGCNHCDYDGSMSLDDL